MSKSHARDISEITRVLSSRHTSIEVSNSVYELVSILEVVESMDEGKTPLNSRGNRVTIQYLLNLMGVFQRKNASIQRLKYAIRLLYAYKSMSFPGKCSDIAELVFGERIIHDFGTSP